jgi:hypothetical protein
MPAVPLKPAGGEREAVVPVALPDGPEMGFACGTAGSAKSFTLLQRETQMQREAQSPFPFC